MTSCVEPGSSIVRSEVTMIVCGTSSVNVDVIKISEVTVAVLVIVVPDSAHY